MLIFAGQRPTRGGGQSNTEIGHESTEEDKKNCANDECFAGGEAAKSTATHD